MIKLVAVAFLVAIASPAQAIPRAAVQQPDSLVTTVREACGAGMHRVRLSDRATMLDIIQSHASDAATQKMLIEALKQYMATWPELKVDDIRKFMLSIVPHIQVHADRIDISVNPNNLPRWFDGSGGHVKDLQQPCPTMIGIS
jgi:hypothetical protein